MFDATEAFCGFIRSLERRASSRGGVRTAAVRALAVGFCLTMPFAAGAQSAGNEAARVAGAAEVLSVVRWNGSLAGMAGRTVELRFSLFQDQAGGLALWSETQTVKIDANGRYSVLLGATSAEGLPQGLFQAGQARWIE